MSHVQLSSPSRLSRSSSRYHSNVDEETSFTNEAPWLHDAVLRGHTDTVRNASYSPQGDLIASASEDATLALWDAFTLEMVATLEGHEKDVHSVSFNGVGSLLASASRDETVRVWDVESRQCRHTLVGHDGWVRSVSFSRDSTRIASAGQDRRVILYEVESGRLLARFEGHTDVASDVTFSHDDRQLISSSWDCTIKLWSIPTAEALAEGEVLVDTPVRTIRGHSQKIYGLSSSRLGLLASCSRDTTIRIWDIETGQPSHILRGHSDSVKRCSFGRDGRTLASVSNDKLLKTWDAVSGRELQTFQGHRGIVWSVNWSPSGAFLITASSDKTVRLWLNNVGQCIKTISLHEESVESVDLSGDFGVCCSADNTAVIFSTATGVEVKRLVGHSDKIWTTSISPDGSIVATGSDDRTAKVWTVPDGELVHTLVGHEHWVTGSHFSPDSKLLATSGRDRTVRLWRCSDGQLLHTLTDSEHWVRCVAWSPTTNPDGGMLLAAGLSDRRIFLYDVAQGAEEKPVLREKELLGHTGEVNDLAFHPNGAVIATASHDRTTRLYSTATSKLITTVQSHLHYARSVAFNATGKLLASCADDGSVRVFRVDSHYHLTLCAVLLGHRGPVRHVVWQGTVLLSTGTDADLRAWLWHRCPSVTEARLGLEDVVISKQTKSLVKRHPFVSIRSALPEDVIEELRTGESLLHWAARTGRIECLRAIFTSSQATSLQSGPYGSPLRLAVETRNDACVRLMLGRLHLDAQAMVDKSDDDPEFCELLPKLARFYPEELTRALQRLKLLEIPEHQQQWVVGLCSNLEARNGEVFRTGHREPVPHNLWERYFKVRADREMNTLSHLPIVNKFLARRRRRMGQHEDLDMAASLVPFSNLGGHEYVKLPLKQHPLGCLIHYNLHDALGTPVISHVLAFKWRRFAQAAFLRQMVAYLFFLAMFTLAVYFEDACYDVTDIQGVGRTVLDVLVVLFTLNLLRFEVHQLVTDGARKYLTDGWNWVDLVGQVTVVALVPLRLLCDDHFFTVASVAAVSLWLKTLDFARAFEQTGPFVRMLFRIARAIGFFMMILLVVLVAFSHGFYLLFRGVETGGNDVADDLGTRFAILRLYGIVLSGEFERTDFSSARAEWLALVYVVIFTSFVTILMLNLLIALMGFVYNEVQVNVENEWLMERAQVILDIEHYMRRTDRENNRFFPRWIHVLRPKFKEDPVAETGQSDTQRLQTNLTREVKRVERHIDDRVDQLHAQLRQLAAALHVHDASDDEAKEQ